MCDLTATSGNERYYGFHGVLVYQLQEGLFKEFNCDKKNSVNFNKKVRKCTFEILERKKFLILQSKSRLFI